MIELVDEIGLGHLEQGRFKSFPNQTDDYFHTVVRYVERNPLRANLVAQAPQTTQIWWLAPFSGLVFQEIARGSLPVGSGVRLVRRPPSTGRPSRRFSHLPEPVPWFRPRSRRWQNLLSPREQRQFPGTGCGA